MFSPDELLFLPPDPAALPPLQGLFARRILVLSADDLQTGGDPDFLGKILAAAQINLRQDTLLAEIQEGLSLSILPVLKQKQPMQCLVFGLTARQLGLHLNPLPYQPFEFYQSTFLFADKLSLLEPDKARKGQLWRALQAIFL